MSDGREKSSAPPVADSLEPATTGPEPEGSPEGSMESPEDGTDSDDTKSEPPPETTVRSASLRRILRRFGPAVVAIGVAIFASPLADQWPSSHSIEIALDAPAEVQSVSLSIVPHGETDAIFATSWTFESGQAPSRVSTRLTTPSGAYDASIVTVRGSASVREETKRVDLNGNRITLFAR